MAEFENPTTWRLRVASSLKAVGCGDFEITHLLESDADLKTVAAYGFAFCQTAEVDHMTRGTVWWASQALKKFSGGAGVTTELRDKAVADFVQRNTEARGMHLHWSYWNRVRALLKYALPEVPDSAGVGRFGPGAVAEGLDALQRWSIFEDCDFSPRSPSLKADGSSCYVPIPKAGSYDPSMECSRLTAVPKDAWRARLITVEPARASFLQQWVRDIMMVSIHSGPLRGTPMDFLSYRDNVEIQRLRCLRGSKTLATSTVDLRDASDHIGFEDVLATFPGWLTCLLEISRVPYFTDGKTKSELWMYGGMGNATTFLIETLYFWAVFTALLEDFHLPGRVTTFGDDIVLPSSCNFTGFVSWCADKLGVLVNPEKTCMGADTMMREACGLAAYGGVKLPELIRIHGYRPGLHGTIGLCGLVNRLELGPLPCHRCLAEMLRDELPSIPTVSSHTFNGEWLNPDCDVFLVEGEPAGELTPTIGYCRSLQYHYAKVNTLRARTKRYRLKELSACQALGLLRGQIHTKGTVRGRTLIELDLPYTSHPVSTRLRLD